MTVRPGTESDIPGIIELLRLSLGEQRMAKTEEFWKWKHVNNPFGRSDVLLAFDGDRMTGLRVFMKWEWAQGDTIMKAVRAVDTATHPAYQGKGVFSMLTLALVEHCRKNEVDFVFNTPNSKSRPGYLKMGWHHAGRLSLRIKPSWFSRSQSRGFLDEYRWTREWAKSFSFESGDKLATRISTNYLAWRYGANPNVTYQLLLDAAPKPSYAIVFRLKRRRLGTEFRICDSFLSEAASRESLGIRLKQAIRQSGASMVSWSSWAVPLSPIATLPIGPIVTLLPLSTRSAGVNLHTWSPSIGDLEVF